MLNKCDDATKFLYMLSTDIDLAFDIESNGLNWKKCFVCGYSISDGRDAVYVPVRHEPGGNINNTDEFEKTINNTIKKRTKKLIMHNGKFDMHFCQNHGISLGKNLSDTMIRGALLDENKFSYSLKNLCKGYKIAQKDDINDYIAEKFNVPKKNAMGHFWRLHGQDEKAVHYAAQDTLATYQLWEAQARDLYAQQMDVILSIEEELIYVLQKMERQGVKIDQAEADSLKEEIEALQVEAYQNIPLTEDLEIVNVKSNKDLQKYFEFLGIEDWPVTEKGNPSFTKNYLKGFEEGEQIMHARKLDHFMNSFIDPLAEHIHNGRVYTNFNQTAGEFGGTRTGRLSSYGPNMQQIPKRDKMIGPKYRKIFIPDEEFLLIEFDYSQMEPRLFTHYSNEPILLDGYNQTPFIDMHDIACQYMGLYEQYGTDDSGRDSARSFAKNLNLGMMYAMGALKLAIALGCTEDEAKSIRNRWYRTFVKVREFTKAAAERAEQRNYVKTILGRRCHITDPRFSYKAANRIVQGGCSDILKWKLVQINRWIEKNDLDDVCKMLLTIHDSILFEIHKSRLDLIPVIKELLERIQCAPFNLKVPFVAEYKCVGSNWGIATYGESIYGKPEIHV